MESAKPDLNEDEFGCNGILAEDIDAAFTIGNMKAKSFVNQKYLTISYSFCFSSF